MAVVNKLIALCLGLIYSFPVTLRLIYLLLKNPISFFRKKDRTNPPSCLTSEKWSHKYARISNIKLHYVEAGDEGKPLMVMVHGFPEFWYSWRHQIIEFAKDYRVVALDNRGYCDSDVPPNLSDYDIDYLAKDVKELIEYLGYKKAVVVAHDWGGLIASTLAMDYPDVVSHLICMNGPHPGAFKARIYGYRTQFFKSWYIFLFQLPFLPELLISNHDYAAVREMFKAPPTGLKNNSNFTEEDVEAFKYAVSRPGTLTAGINYYRAIAGNDRDFSARIKMPHLVIFGTGDIAIDLEVATNTALYCDDFSLKLVEGASHWVQQDEPETVNKIIREYLDSKA